jgi:hypothetical protein
MNNTPLGEVWESIVALRDDWKDEAHRGLSQELGHIADAVQDIRDVQERGVSYEWACRCYDLLMAYSMQAPLLDPFGPDPASDLCSMLAPLLRVPLPAGNEGSDAFRTKIGLELGKLIAQGAVEERPYLKNLTNGKEILAEVMEEGVLRLRVASWRHWNCAGLEHASYGVVTVRDRTDVDTPVPAHRLWDYDAEMNETTKKLLQAKLGQHGMMELFCGHGTSKDYPWEPSDNANYINVCSTCESQFRGHKHTAICAECQAIHKEWWQTLSLEQQEAHRQAAMVELQKLIDERKKSEPCSASPTT